MGKLVYLVMAVIAVQVMLFVVFDINFPTATLWNLFLNPQSWDSLNFTAIIVDAITAVSAVAFVGGLVFKNDLMVFGGLAGVFFSFGKQLASFWQQINSQPFFGDASGLMASLIVGPIIFLYIFTIIEWWRGRD